jgi:hypothetical protein
LDIFELIGKSYNVLKKNLILFLPSLVLTYLAPVALAIVALYLFVPVLVVAGNLSDPMLVLMGGGFIDIVILIVLAVILFVTIVAGMSNLNKVALQKGQTSFKDFKIGAKKYFGRILGGTILLGIIYLIIFSIGLGSAITMIAPAFTGLQSSEMFKEGFPETFDCPFLSGDFSDAADCPFIQGFPGGMASIQPIIRAFANVSGIALILVTIAALIFIFTIFWIPAAVVDDLGIFKAIGKSVSFVRENFYTTIGFLGLFIIAELFTSQLFPPSIGGGFRGGFSMTPGALAPLFQLIITTFFALLLFAIYIDRTKKTEPPSESISNSESKADAEK